MSLRREAVVGLQQLQQQLQQLEKEGGPIFVLFSGDRDPQTGNSWCPDCEKAEPVVEKVVASLPQLSGVLVHCTVGDRTTWKDPNNPFRTNSDLKLTGVPTLIQWRTSKRLGPEQCAQEELVKILFEDD